MSEICWKFSSISDCNSSNTGVGLFVLLRIPALLNVALLVRNANEMQTIKPCHLYVLKWQVHSFLHALCFVIFFPQIDDL